MGTVKSLKHCQINPLVMLMNHVFYQVKVICMLLNMGRHKIQKIMWRTVGITLSWFEVAQLQMHPIIFCFLEVGRI